MQLENKSVDGPLRGYVFFRVRAANSETLYFSTYQGARQTFLPLCHRSMVFWAAYDGLHIFKGWRCFALFREARPPCA